jgi:hypothetical protein
MSKKKEDEKLQKETLFLEMNKKKKEQELLEKNKSVNIVAQEKPKGEEQNQYKSPSPFKNMLNPKPEPK